MGIAQGRTNVFLSSQRANLTCATQVKSLKTPLFTKVHKMDPETPLRASNSAKIAVLQRRSKDGQVLPGKIGSVKDVEIPPDYYCKCRQLKSSCSVCNEGWRQRSLPGLTILNGKAVPCTTPHPETAPMPVAAAGSSEGITDTFQSPMSESNFSPIRGDDPVLAYLDKDFDRDGLGEDYEAGNGDELMDPDSLITGVATELRAEVKVAELVRKLEEAEAANTAVRTDLKRERRDNAEALQVLYTRGEESTLQMKQQHELHEAQLQASEKLSEEKEAQLITRKREVEVSKHEKDVLLRDTELQLKQQLEEREAQLRITMSKELEEREAQLRTTMAEAMEKERETLEKERETFIKEKQELYEQKVDAETAVTRVTREKATVGRHLADIEKNYWWAEEMLGKAVQTLDVKSQAAREFLKDNLDADWWPPGFDPDAKAQGPEPADEENAKEGKPEVPVQDLQGDGTSTSHEAPPERPKPPEFPKAPTDTPKSAAKKAYEHSPGSGAGWGDEAKSKWGSNQSSPSAPERDDRWKDIRKPDWEQERDRIQAERAAAQAAGTGATGAPPPQPPPQSSAPKSRVKEEPAGDPDGDGSSSSSDEEENGDQNGEGRDREYKDQDPPSRDKDYGSGGSDKPPGKKGPGGDDKDGDNGRKGNSDQNDIKIMASAMVNAVEKLAEIAEKSSDKGWKPKRDDRKYHPKSLEANKMNAAHATVTAYNDIDQTFKYKHIWIWREMEKEIEKYLLLLYNSEDVGKNVWKAIQDGVNAAQYHYHRSKDQKEKMLIEPMCDFHKQEEQVSRDLWLQLQNKFPAAVQTRVQEKKESHERATGRLEDAIFMMRLWCTPTTVPQKEDCRLKFSKKPIDWSTLESGKERLNIILIKWRQNLRVLVDCGAIN